MIVYGIFWKSSCIVASLQPNRLAIRFDREQVFPISFLENNATIAINFSKVPVHGAFRQALVLLMPKSGRCASGVQLFVVVGKARIAREEERD